MAPTVAFHLILEALAAICAAFLFLAIAVTPYITLSPTQGLKTDCCSEGYSLGKFDVHSAEKTFLGH